MIISRGIIILLCLTVSVAYVFYNIYAQFDVLKLENYEIISQTIIKYIKSTIFTLENIWCFSTAQTSYS